MTPPCFRRRARRVWLPPLLLALAFNAAAHDTWFMPQAAEVAGLPLLALGTGERFPRQETALDMDKVDLAACLHPDGRAVPLQWLAYRDDATLLRPAQPAAPGQRLRCWMQAQPLSITLDDAVVLRYFDEIRALPAVRDRWTAQRARGVRWQETYTKHARIEGAGPGLPGLPPVEAGMPGLDLQPDMPAAALRAGDRLRVRLLRDGRPLAGLPVALHNDLSPLVLWQASDADGWVTLVLPLTARWLVTSVDLRPSGRQANAWESRFASLAIETLPRR
jgi:hypothetical protein